MVAISHAAQAHGIVGNRVFPGTLAFDDPAVMDELILSAVSSFKHSGERADVTDDRIGGSFMRLLTSTLAFEIESGWMHPLQRFHDDEPAGRFKNGIDVGADHLSGDCLVLFAILLRLGDRLQRRTVQNCKIVHGCRLSTKGRAPQAGCGRLGDGANATPHSNATLYSCVIVSDGTRAATLEKRRLRYVAAFVGQLLDKPLLASIYSCGVSKRIAQWQIEKLRADPI
jgi:hypothetical protein